MVRAPLPASASSALLVSFARFASVASLPFATLALPPSPAGADTRAASTRVGLYAFDGTGADASFDSVIHQAFERAGVRPKAYFAGPDIAGSTVRSIIERGKARVCNDWRSGRVDAVALTGYSRGAIIAMAVAHELLMPAGPDGRTGCDNVTPALAGVPRGLAVVPKSFYELNAFLGRGDAPRVASLALLDACNTLNRDIGGNVTAAVRRASPSTRCRHLVKKVASEGPLSTLALEDCEATVETTDARHNDLGTMRSVRDTLEGWLAHGDLAFGDAPDLASLPPADYRALCARVGDSAPGAGDGYARCVKSLCSWEGRPTQGRCVAPDTTRGRLPPIPELSDASGPPG